MQQNTHKGLSIKVLLVALATAAAAAEQNTHMCCMQRVMYQKGGGVTAGGAPPNTDAVLPSISLSQALLQLPYYICDIHTRYSAAAAPLDAWH